MTPYTRPPVSTNLATRNRLRDGNLIAIYGNLTAFCRILPYSTKSTEFCYILPSLLNPTKFCQDRYLNPILPRTLINQATKLTIYTLFPLFPYLLSLRNVLTLS